MTMPLQKECRKHNVPSVGEEQTMYNICNNLFVSMTGGYLKKNNFSHLNNLSNIHNGTCKLSIHIW